MIKRIGHMAMTVFNMEKSLEFYCDILGLERVFEIKDDDQNPWIEYVKVAPGQFIELFHGGRRKPEEGEQPIGFHHLCLEVYNIHETAAHLKLQGITLDAEPARGKDNNLQCWLKDPDGNRIELMQLDPSSPQMNC
jgi:catechol 2,3-dioxygenase-like lactoylglutathione lyase family enzyme